MQINSTELIAAIKSLKWLLFLVVLKLTSGVAQEKKEWIVGEVQVQGLELLDPIEVKSRLGIQVWDHVTLPGPKTQEGIKRLWEAQLFEDVQLSFEELKPGIARITVGVKEAPLLSKIIIEGVRPRETQEVYEQIAGFTGKAYSEVTTKKIRKTLERHYEESSIVGSEISVVIDTNAPLRPVAKVSITKGQRYRHIIDGLSGVSNEDLKALNRQLRRKPGPIPFKLLPDRWNSSSLQETEKVVSHYFLEQGYLDTEVTFEGSDTLKRQIRTKWNVSPGQQYVWGEFAVKNGTLFSDSLILQRLNLKTGEVADFSVLEQRLGGAGGVSSLYVEHGYLYFSAEPVITGIRDSVVDIEIRLYEGDVAILGGVTIAGNTRTRDEIFLRELTTVPGDTFRSSEVMFSQQRLAALGYVDPFSIQVVPLKNFETGNVDLKYKLEENPADQIRFSGSWIPSVGFAGSVGLSLMNFSLEDFVKMRVKQWNPLPTGQGQGLSINYLSNAQNFNTFSIGFREPWFGGKKRHQFNVNFNRSKQLQLDDEGVEIGHLRVVGGGVNWALQAPPQFRNWQLFLGSNFQHYDIQDSTSALCDSCQANKWTFTAGIVRDGRRFGTFFPNSGSYFYLGVNATLPYSALGRNPDELSSTERYRWMEYHKWNLDYSWFWTFGRSNKTKGARDFTTSVNKRPVLNLRGHLGYIGSYGSALSPFDRFILGGSGFSGFNPVLGSDFIGLRGYQEQSVTPSDIGGSVFSKFVAELRYPLSLKGSVQSYLLGFAEAGASENSLEAWNPWSMKKSAGAGIRLRIQGLGDFGFDMGYGFDECPGCNGWQPHLSFGTQIR